MGVFDAPTPTPVELKGTSTTTAPQYLTDYLTNLASAGTGALGTVSPEGTLTPYTGSELIADLPQNLQDLYQNAGTMAARYETPMDEALKALQSGATGVTAQDISKFYNPYEQDVVDEMARQSALNVQRSTMPALKAAFAGSGGFGGQRYAGATGQAMADIQANLLGQQSKLRQEGYQSALDAALKERGYDIQAGQGLYGLGGAEATAASNMMKSLGDVGTAELSYDQSKLEAPLVRAQNVAEIMRGYTYPTSTSEVKESLPTAYAPSALQQVSGLSSLISSAFGNDNAAGYKAIDFFKNLIKDSSSTGGFDWIPGFDNWDASAWEDSSGTGVG